MKGEHIYYVAPFRRRAGQLREQDLVTCTDEDTCFRLGRNMMRRMDGLVFFRIECSEDGDVWSRADLLATVGDVPDEAT